MSRQTFERQIGRRGLVLCHYRVPSEQKARVMLSNGPAVTLLTGGLRGHAFALGWTYYGATPPGRFTQGEARAFDRRTRRVTARWRGVPR